MMLDWLHCRKELFERIGDIGAISSDTTKEEIVEALGVAVALNAGSVMVYSARASTPSTHTW